MENGVLFLWLRKVPSVREMKSGTKADAMREPHRSDRHVTEKKMIKRVLILCFLGLLGACVSYPDVRVRVDTRVVPLAQYERDHEDCLRQARSVWPVTVSQLKQNWRLYYPVLVNQEMFVIDCLSKKGYRVLDEDEPEYF